MGVQGLWDLLAPVGHRVGNEHVRNKIVAVDVSIWLTQFIKAMRDAEGAQVRNAHLLGVFRRCVKLLFLSVKPVLVFDGATPAIKRRTVASRRAEREKHAAKLKRLAEKLLLNRIKKEIIGDAISEKRKSVAEIGLSDARRDIQRAAGEDKTNDNRAETIRNHLEESDEDRIEPNPPNNERPNAESEKASLDQMFLESESVAVDVPQDFPGGHGSGLGIDMFNLPKNIDELDDDALVGLPANMQSEIFKQIKLEQRAEHRENMMAKQNNPAEFSKTQIDGFIKRTELNKKISNARNVINFKSGASQRIASDSRRQFLFEEKALVQQGYEEIFDLDEPDDDVLEKANSRGQVRKSSASREPPKDLLSRIRAQRDASYNSVRLAESPDTALPVRKPAETSGVGWASRVLAGQGGLKLNRNPIRTSVLNKHGKIASSSPHGEDDICDESEFHGAVQQQTGGDRPSLSEQNFAESAHITSSDSDDVEWEEAEQLEGDQSDDDFTVNFDGKSARKVSSGGVTFDRREDVAKPHHSKSVPAELRRVQPAIPLSSNARRDDLTNPQVQTELVSSLSREEQKSNVGSVTPQAKPHKYTESGSHRSRDSEERGSTPCNAHLEQEERKDSTGEDHKRTPSQESDERHQQRRTHPRTARLESLSSARSAGTADAVQDNILPTLDAETERETSEATHEYTRIQDQTLSDSHEYCANGKDDDAKAENDNGPSRPRKNAVPPTSRSRQTPGDTHTGTNVTDVGEQSPLSPDKERQNMADRYVIESQRRENGSSSQRESNPELTVRKEDFPDLSEEANISLQRRDSEITPSACPDHQESEPKDNNSDTQKQLSLSEMENLEADLQNEAEEMKKMKAAHQGGFESVSDEMYAEVRDLLKLFGIPYLEAPMEAEAQCAFLNSRNVVDGIITEDSDAWLFGAKTIYRQLFAEGKFAEVYEAEDIQSTLGLERKHLIRLAYLLGSDYTSGVRGVGVVNAMEIMEAFPGEHGLQEFQEWTEKVTVLDKEPDEAVMTGVSADAVRRRFCWKHRNMKRNWDVREGFPNPTVHEAYMNPAIDSSTEKFRWGKINFKELAKFCWDKFGWEGDRFDRTIGPLREKLKESNDQNQRRIDEYFKPHRFAKIRSERLQKAVLGMAGEEARASIASSAPRRPRKRKAKVGTYNYNQVSKREEMEMLRALEQVEKQPKRKRTKTINSDNDSNMS